MDIAGTAKKQRKHLRTLEHDFNAKTKGETPDKLFNGEKLIQMHN
jgi:hypothetical protein